jgi:hypothetical protein
MPPFHRPKQVNLSVISSSPQVRVVVPSDEDDAAAQFFDDGGEELSRYALPCRAAARANEPGAGGGNAGGGVTAAGLLTQPYVLGGSAGALHPGAASSMEWLWEGGTGARARAGGGGGGEPGWLAARLDSLRSSEQRGRLVLTMGLQAVGFLLVRADAVCLRVCACACQCGMCEVMRVLRGSSASVPCSRVCHLHAAQASSAALACCPTDFTNPRPLASRRPCAVGSLRGVAGAMALGHWSPRQPLGCRG